MKKKKKLGAGAQCLIQGAINQERQNGTQDGIEMGSQNKGMRRHKVLVVFNPKRKRFEAMANVHTNIGATNNRLFRITL